MYLTAHHVRSSKGHEGINAFRHWHGDGFAWPADASALPEDEPGELDPGATSVTVPPGGNRVRAYLDVLAPDGTPASEIDGALGVLAGDLAQRRNPTIFRIGEVTVRFGVERGLESAKVESLEQLTKVVRRLRRLPRPGA